MNKYIYSNVIWKFFERILAQGITFIVALILARLLTPNEFGLVALVMVFINVINAVVTSGFSTALIQNNNADDLDFSSVFWFGFIISIIIYIFIYYFAKYIAVFYNNELIVPVFRVLSLRVILSSINSVQHAYVARKLQFKKYFFSTLFGTLISAIIGVCLAIKGYGVWAIVFQYLSNTAIDTIVLLITVEWKPKLIFSFVRLKQLFSFGSKILIDTILFYVQYNLRNLIIGKMYNTSELAYYTNAQRIPSVFINNVSQSVSSVLLPVMSNVNTDEKRVLMYLRKSSKLCAYIVFPVLLVIILVSNEFVNVFLTSKWSPMIPYLQLYCVICFTQVLMPPRNEALKAIGRSDIFLQENTFVRIFDVIIMFIFISNGSLFLMFTSLVSYLLSIIVLMFNAQKYNNYSFLTQLVDIKNTVIACLFVVIFVLIISCLNFSLLPMMISKVLIAMTVYVVTSIVFEFEEFDILLKLIKQYTTKIIGNNRG